MTDVRALVCAVGAAAVSFAAAVGCSSSADPDSATTAPASRQTTTATTTATVTAETTAVAPAPTAAPGSYAACLAEQGIDAPVDPTLGPPPGPAPPPAGVDESAWQQAVLTCTDLVAGTG